MWLKWFEFNNKIAFFIIRLAEIIARLFYTEVTNCWVCKKPMLYIHGLENKGFDENGHEFYYIPAQTCGNECKAKWLENK